MGAANWCLYILFLSRCVINNCLCCRIQWQLPMNGLGSIWFSRSSVREALAFFIDVVAAVSMQLFIQEKKNSIHFLHINLLILFTLHSTYFAIHAYEIFSIFLVLLYRIHILLCLWRASNASCSLVFGANARTIFAHHACNNEKNVLR